MLTTAYSDAIIIKISNTYILKILCSCKISIEIVETSKHQSVNLNSQQ